MEEDYSRYLRWKETEKENSRHMRWKQATKALLGAVRKATCQPYSIPVVPDELRKSNESAYMPKVVSIGPQYKGRKELLAMEEIKWKCVTSLLSRTFGLDAIERCMEAVMELDAAVRTSYVGEITLDKYALATTMVFDGCFLLELLICESKLDSEIPIPFNGISPGKEVKKMEYVITDLMLLENQIPIFILETLFEKLLGSSHQMRKLIQNLALALFGFSGKSIIKSTFHFLDIAYSYIEFGWVDKKIEETKERPSLLDMEEEEKKKHLNRCATRLKVDTEEEEEEKKGEEEEDKKKKHLSRCATRLKAAGITIQPLNIDGDHGDINFKLTTEFNGSEGILQIPKLNITKTTEVSWRSFIAWEHHIKKLKSSNSSSVTDDRLSVCTSSALLFSDLICCSSDVKLLKEKEVIVDHLKTSNQDLVVFFHKIAEGVDRSIIDHKHEAVFSALNKFPSKCYIKKIFILLFHFFGKIFDWCYDNVYTFLKSGYNFPLTLVTFLTFVQTCYTIIAYHFPNSK